MGNKQNKIRVSLNALDDDVLTVILSHLTVKEMIGLARVCKRWEKLTTYLLAEVTTFNFETWCKCKVDKLHPDLNRGTDLYHMRDFFNQNSGIKIRETVLK